MTDQEIRLAFRNLANCWTGDLTPLEIMRFNDKLLSVYLMIQDKLKEPELEKEQNENWKEILKWHKEEEYQKRRRKKDLVIKMIEAYTKQKFWELINSIFRYRTECECDHPNCKIDHSYNYHHIQTVCEKYKDIETGKILMIADSITFDLLPVLEIKL